MKHIFLILFLSGTLASCKIEPSPVEYVYKSKVIAAKTVDFDDGDTRYNVAFTDGTSMPFGFGQYSKYNVGDTVCFRSHKEFEHYWIIEYK